LYGSVEVPYFGHAAAEVIFVGESPGREEENATPPRPFIGRAGKLLRKGLLRLGAPPGRFVFVNSARCLINKKRMSADEIKKTLTYCRFPLVSYFKRQKPKLLVILGEYALNQVLRLEKISKYRGKLVWSTEFNCWCLPTYHPAYILRSPHKEPIFLGDLKEALVFVNAGFKPNNDLDFESGEVQSIRPLLNLAKTEVVRAGADTETQGLDYMDPKNFLISWSVSWADSKGWQIFIHERCSAEEAEFFYDPQVGSLGFKIPVKRAKNFDQKMRQLREFCENPRILKIFHNANYDLHHITALFKRYGLAPPEYSGIAMDTQAAAHTLDPATYVRTSLETLQRDFDDKASLWKKESGIDKTLVIQANREALTTYACLSKDSVIRMADGSSTPIRRLVSNKSTKEVLSYNEQTKQFEAKKINGWFRIVTSHRISWFKVRTGITRNGRGGLLAARYTEDHRLLTAQGWKEVRELVPGDRLVTPFVSLSPEQRQIVLGGLLGDSGLESKRKSGFAALKMGHCKKQWSYLEWKTSFFKDMLRVGEIRNPRNSIINGYAAKTTAYKMTKTAYHPELGDLFAATYAAKGKRHLSTWVDELTPLGLAVWYMDDGTLVGRHTNSKSIRFYTLAFPISEVEHLIAMFSRKFGITAGFYLESRYKRPVLTVNTDECHRVLFGLLAPYIHPCLSYKLPYSYQGQFSLPSPSFFVPVPYQTEVKAVERAPVSESRRGYSFVQYCIGVEDNHNFCTQNEIAKNCGDSVFTRKVGLILKEKLSQDTRLAHYFRRLVMPVEIHSLRTLEENGVYVDREALRTTRAEILETLKRAEADAISRVPARIRESHATALSLSRGDLIRDTLFSTSGFDLTPPEETASGRFSVNKEARAKLKAMKGLPKEALEFLLAYEEWQEWNNFQSRNIPQMASFIRSDGRMHSNFAMCVAVTGRISSSSPNLLNLPKRSARGKLIKRLIVPERPGWSILEIDLSQAELRWLAQLSGDRELVKVYQNGDDIHLRTAKAMVAASKKTWEELSKDEQERQRTFAKPSNFGLIYGAGPKGFSDYALTAFGVKFSIEKAKRIRKVFFDTYPGIADYHERLVKQCKKMRFVLYSPLGRKWTISLLGSEDLGDYGEGERRVKNYPIQSASSDTVLLCLANMLKDKALDPTECIPILFVHDSLLLEVKDEKVEYYAALVKSYLENPPLKQFGIDLIVPFVADCAAGPNAASTIKINI
jgi:uracil-DNA glycosylase family 4